MAASSLSWEESLLAALDSREGGPPVGYPQEGGGGVREPRRAMEKGAVATRGQQWGK